MTIERSFRDIPEGKLDEADQQPFLVGLGWSNAAGWDELLRSKRILVISEAGAGKTYECRSQRQHLWDAGEPAFVLELATLATSDLRSMLDDDEEKRLDAWVASQSDIATFFLDSVDELKLSLGSFEQARRSLLPLRRRYDPVVQKDLLDRASTYLVSQVVERAADPRVAPSRISPRHRHDELRNLGRCFGSANLADTTPVVLLRDQLPIPWKQGVRRHHRADPEEPLAPYPLRHFCQASALGTGEPQPLTPKLLPPDPILDLQVLDHVLLIAVHPAGHDRDEELEVWREHGRERSLSARPTVGRGCSPNPQTGPQSCSRFNRP